MSRPSQLAQILYVAINGTVDEALTCSHILEFDDDRDDGDERCGLPLAGVCVDDGYPLCDGHTVEEGGYRLSPAELLDLTHAIERVRGER